LISTNFLLGLFGRLWHDDVGTLHGDADWLGNRCEAKKEDGWDGRCARLFEREANTQIDHFPAPSGTRPVQAQLARLAPLVAVYLVLVAVGTLAGRLLARYPPRGDLAIVDRLEDHRSGVLNFMALTVSHLGSEIVLGVLAVVAVAFLASSRRRRDAMFVASASLGGLALGSILKSIVERPRPPYEQVVVVHSSGFPSEHALGAFVVYLSLAWVVARPRPGSLMGVAALVIAAGTALLVGVSRIYLGIHYPSDILGSFVLAAVWVLACAWAFGLAPRFGRAGAVDGT
jgi:membrane-associated phospholipid phosphatase